MLKKSYSTSRVLCLAFLAGFCVDMRAVEHTTQEKLRSHFFLPQITSLDVSDWQNPTVKDYQLIQTFIREKVKRLVDAPLEARPFENDFLNTEFYGWITYRMNRREFVGYGDDAPPPIREVVYFNNDPENKNKCVICYASYYCPETGGDRNYMQGITAIIRALKKHGFDGHFIYYIGGWPNLKKDRLKYADVPYAFKPFFFEEMKELGYENVLWIDACTVPVKNLDPIFAFIKQHGLCYFRYGRDIPWDEFNRAYHLLMPSIDFNMSYHSIISQVVGINLNDDRGSRLLAEWIKAAEGKVPFLQSDQPPFGFIVNNLRYTHGQLPYSCMVETPCGTGDFAYWNTNSDAFFYHQYDFVNTQYASEVEAFR